MLSAQHISVLCSLSQGFFLEFAYSLAGYYHFQIFALHFTATFANGTAKMLKFYKTKGTRVLFATDFYFLKYILMQTNKVLSDTSLLGW